MMPNKTMHIFSWLLCLAVFLAFAQSAIADETEPVARATKEEAMVFVKKAVEYFKANGSEKAFAEFDDPKGKFIDKDLYIFSFDSAGVCLASGAHHRLIGTNRIDQQDTDGNYYVEERVKLMKTHASFWTHFKYPDPLTKKILPKSVYCEVVNDPALKDIIICSGVYDAKP
jgi:cytochrome c